MKALSHIFALVVGIAIGYGLFAENSSRDKITNKLSKNKSLITSDQLFVQNQKTFAVEDKNLKSENSGKLNGLVEKFWEKINNESFEEAQALVDEMGVVSPNSREYNESLTRVLVRLRDYEKAKPALKTCLRLFPKSKSCLEDLASIELSMGTVEEQFAAAQSCLSVFSNSPTCLNNLAIARMNEGNYESAVTLYEQLLSSNGNFGFRFDVGMLYSQLGYALEGAGRMAEALQSFAKACGAKWPGACTRYEELNKSN